MLTSVISQIAAIQLIEALQLINFHRWTITFDVVWALPPGLINELSGIVIFFINGRNVVNHIFFIETAWQKSMNIGDLASSLLLWSVGCIADSVSR